jgi:hypothetical protein
MEALTKMGAHLRSLKAFEVGADITSEVVLDDGQKIQFAQKVNILTRLPDKLLAEVDGDLAKRLYVYDGKSFTLLAARAGYFVTTTAPSTLSQLVDILEDKYNIEIPLADLFRWGGPNAPTNRISSALDVGPAQVGGVSCRQYAYRQPGIDWQVWIQRGDYPSPRKIVVTTTTDEARPQYTSTLTWNLAPAYNDAAFTLRRRRAPTRFPLPKTKLPKRTRGIACIRHTVFSRQLSCFCCPPAACLARPAPGMYDRAPTPA